MQPYNLLAQSIEQQSLRGCTPLLKGTTKGTTFFYKALNINQLEVVPLIFKGATIKNNNNENRDFQLPKSADSRHD